MMFHRLTHSIFTGMIAACCATVLAACNLPPKREPPPKIRDVPPRTSYVAPQSQPGDTQAVRALVRRVDLAIESPLGKAWANVSTGELLAETVETWKSNGVRIGVLHRKDYKIFMDSLKDTLGIATNLIAAGNDPVALRASAKLDRPQKFKYASAEGETVETLPRGEPRFLLRLRTEDDGTVGVALTPQHHFEQFSLTPRTPLEAELDGRLFSELTLVAKLTQEDILVVAWDHPEPAPPASQPSDAPATQPEPQPQCNPKLGDIWLTAKRLGRPAQSILLIGLPEKK